MKLESYVRPAGLEAALAVLAEPGLKPLVVAGGTDLIPMMRKMRMSGTLSNGDGPRVVLDLSKLVALCGIREEGGMLEIGAATTMGVIAADPSVRRLCPGAGRRGRLSGQPAGSQPRDCRRQPRHRVAVGRHGACPAGGRRRREARRRRSRAA